MEWYEILLAVLAALVIFIILACVYFKNKESYKEYTEMKRKARFYSRKQVLKEIEIAKSCSRTGAVIDGQIDAEVKKELENSGCEVSEYTDYRGYPCVRISFKEQ